MKVYFDCEYTGLHQNTTLISIGLVDDLGRQFYAELDDFDLSQVDDWIKENVTNHLWIQNPEKETSSDENLTYCCDNKEGVATELRKWLSKYDTVEMWGDVLAYDWVLFCELFGGAFHIPENVFYIPVDLSTILTIRNGFDDSFHPDMDREELASMSDAEQKHNALWDAIVIRECYYQLVK